MKARIQTGAVLLCCFEDPDELSALLGFFTERRITVHTAGPDAMEQTVGALLGLPGSDAQPQTVPGSFSPEPALIFSALSDRALEQTLTALRQSGLAQHCLKAVLTPHNRSWTLGALLEELRTERAFFAAKENGSKEQSK